MSFNRDLLPDPLPYFEEVGLSFVEKRGQWRSTNCPFHGGSDSLRVNTKNGAFVCMAGCGAKGGDVLAFHMAHAGLDFVAAAKSLGAWVEDGKPTQSRPTPISARSALDILKAEATLTAVAAGNLGRGLILTDIDLARLMCAAGRIARICELFA